MEINNVVKAAEQVIVKSWFLESKGEELGYIITDVLEVIRETEKSVYGKINTSYGEQEIWVPKSCLV